MIFSNSQPLLIIILGIIMLILSSSLLNMDLKAVIAFWINMFLSFLKESNKIEKEKEKNANFSFSGWLFIIGWFFIIAGLFRFLGN